MSDAIHLDQVSHRYGERQALSDVSFDVHPREIFGLLGPNGGGKTTLFRILSTLLPVQSGTVQIFGVDVDHSPAEIRELIGVTFQSPSLDVRLTVYENLKHQGRLYGLSGNRLRDRIEELAGRLSLTDRLKDRAGTLSGGLKRRVEIAKGLMHRPRLLLLDEPSTGLDPGARHDLWQYLKRLQSEGEVSVLVTTHLMEEAEHCDRLGILDRGSLVALDTPEALRASIGGDCLTLRGDQPDHLAQRISEQFGIASRRIGDSIRIERAHGHELLREIVDAFPDDITTASLGKPTLEDVFIQRTGHRFWDAESAERGVRNAE